MNRRSPYSLLGIAVLLAAVPAAATRLRCPPDSLKVGNACIGNVFVSDFNNRVQKFACL